MIAHAEGDVLAHIQPGKNAVLLENENAAAIGTGNRFAFDQHLARGRPDETADDVEQGRFSAPARANQADEFAFGNIGAHIIEHANLFAGALAGKGDGNVAQGNGGRIHRLE